MQRFKFSKNRKALTLLEIIMVIVILGVIASIGSSIIVDSYRNYLLQNTTNKALMKTEIASQQIANLLSMRIPGTTISRNPNNLSDFLLASSPTSVNDNNHSLLEWIASDKDSFSARIADAGKPGWSGFCDVDDSNSTVIKTPGSDLNFANSVMKNLSGGRVGLDSNSTRHPAIFFRNRYYQYDDVNNNEVFYDVSKCMGLVDSNTSCISTVEKLSGSSNKLKFRSPSATRQHKVISEHYKLARTAYAICPRKRANGNIDLILFYNYQPWEGDRLSSSNGDCNFTVGEQAVLVRNATVFKFAEVGNIFRFKLCTQESYGGDFNVTICKERAVIR